MLKSLKILHLTQEFTQISSPLHLNAKQICIRNLPSLSYSGFNEIIICTALTKLITTRPKSDHNKNNYNTSHMKNEHHRVSETVAQA